MTSAALVFAAALALPVSIAAQTNEFAYVRDARAALAGGAAVVDSRPLDVCRDRSLAGSRCLPAAQFLGPHRQLASWRDILWVLGTAGLQGSETVLVVGDSGAERDFVAGVLYLAGSARVLVATDPVPRLLELGAHAGPGTQRSFARSIVFGAPMRDALVILGHELRAMRPPPPLLDGRSEDEYWGAVVRAARGGHLPGAQSVPAARLRAGLGGGRPLLPVGAVTAYAHDPMEGIAYFTLLRAGHGVDARIYAGGWAEWASDGSLAADAVSHPDRGAPAPPRADGEGGMRPAWPWIAGALVFAAAGFAGGVLAARRRGA